MKLKITNKNINPGFAIGIDDNDHEFMVIGGNLCIGEIIEVDPYGDYKNTFIYSKINYDREKLLSKYQDKEGLIHFSNLKEVQSKSIPGRRIFELGEYWVFPEKKIINQLEFLYSKGITQFSRIKITNTWASTIGRLPIITINYFDLLEKILIRKENIKAWYYCERERDLNNGQYADFIIMGNFSETDVQISLWQIIGDGSEVLFAHGLLDRDKLFFKHFDLATHVIDPKQIPKFLNEKARFDLIKKEKWIRIDGRFEKEIPFEMMKLFFPLDELVDEFFQYTLK